MAFLSPRGPAGGGERGLAKNKSLSLLSTTAVVVQYYYRTTVLLLLKYYYSYYRTATPVCGCEGNETRVGIKGWTRSNH
jgi:hypothetical protein